MPEEESELIDPKYGKLDKETVNLLKEYEVSYFREDKPIPFVDGLVIHPVQTRHFEEFAACSSCLSLNKNDDPNGIRMSNLEYLLSKTTLPAPEGQIWSYKIYKLFELIFDLHPGYECMECHSVLEYNSKEVVEFVKSCQDFVKFLQEHGNQFPENGEIPPEPQLKCPSCGNEKFRHVMNIGTDPETKKLFLSVNGHIITKKEFNLLRQIVLFQNFPDYVDDSWVDPDLRRDRDEKLRLEQRNNDLHASIEKKVTGLTITTNYKFDEIYNMSIRRFTMALAMVDDLINYKLLKQAQYSGLSNFPKGFKVDHWMYKPNKDMYGDSYKDTDALQAV